MRGPTQNRQAQLCPPTFPALHKGPCFDFSIEVSHPDSLELSSLGQEKLSWGQKR